MHGAFPQTLVQVTRAPCILARLFQTSQEGKAWFFSLCTFKFKISFKQGNKTYTVRRPGVTSLSIARQWSWRTGGIPIFRKARGSSQVLCPPQAAGPLKHQWSCVTESASLCRGDPIFLFGKMDIRVLTCSPCPCICRGKI